MPVHLLAAVVMLACTGCTRPEPLAGPATPGEDLVVVHDDFHSAILLQTDGVWHEWGFGDRDWLTGADLSTWHALRLAAIPSASYVYRIPVAAGEAWAVDGRSRVALTLTATESAAMRRELAAWIAAPGAPWQRGIVLHEGTHPWVGWRSCHDFTVALLRAAGYDVPASLIRTADPLHRDLVRARANHRLQKVPSLIMIF